MSVFSNVVDFLGSDANYTGRVTDKGPWFKPRSFEEIMAPIKIYSEAYEKASENYDNLIAQTEMWKDKANQERNPEAYQMYKQYSDELQKWSDDFARGMNMTNRSALMGLKKGYTQSIVPIAQAEQAVKDRMATIEKAGSDAVFKKNSFSIDDGLHGKLDEDAETPLSMAAIEAYTAETIDKLAAKNMGSTTPETKVDRYHRLWKDMNTKGGTVADYMQALEGIWGEGVFADTKRRLQNEYDYDSYDEVGKRKIDQAIMKGLLKGIGVPDWQDAGDYKEYYDNLSFYHTDKLQKNQFERQKKEDESKAKDAEKEGQEKGGETKPVRIGQLPDEGIVADFSDGYPESKSVTYINSSTKGEEGGVVSKTANFTVSIPVFDADRVEGDSTTTSVAHISQLYNELKDMLQNPADADAQDLAEKLGGSKDKGVNIDTIDAEKLDDVLTEANDDSKVKQKYALVLGMFMEATADMPESREMTDKAKSMVAAVRSYNQDPVNNVLPDDFHKELTNADQFWGEYPYREVSLQGIRGLNSLFKQYGDKLPSTVQIGVLQRNGVNHFAARLVNASTGYSYVPNVNERSQSRTEN